MACEKLHSELPGKVTLPSDENYDNRANAYHFLSARQRPQCIVSPSSAEDVSVALKVLRGFPDISFAIKSGGHSPHPDVANTNNGVVINLEGLDSIARSSDREDVYELGAGVTWGKVYEVLSKEKRSASGSRECTVGVGGFVTGGGLTYFSPERGFACDDVVNMQVVLASGDIVETNKTTNADLFRALKGSRSNVGIVTRVDIITHARDNIWGGAIMYPATTEDAQLEAFWDFKSSGIYDPHAQVEVSFIYSAAMGCSFVSNNHWYGQHIENPPTFKRFQDIKDQMTNTMRLETIDVFAKELSKYGPKDQHAVYVTTTFTLTPTIMKKINSLWNATSATLSTTQNILSVITYQQCPPPPPADAPNAMGFPATSKPHESLIIFIASLYWDLAADSDFVRQTSRDLMDKIEEATKAEGAFHLFKYMNYAAPWQNVLESYGNEAHDALKDVSAKYDPEGLFQRQALGFKL
ncbi:FAD-binding domain-containing protein [Lophiostoma macrostomum CBS 122681]|uniref:FAD-binding domain-containing protein n=1 Tax=Lophiostoma macrostomum CBS 122681 TaxID=1314788 RepID=A0A6A6TKD0_9PLEO|nr:FAD-binding domain-containing protein [Lophiostoma macrostomum CBS 122681]